MGRYCAPNCSLRSRRPALLVRSNLALRLSEVFGHADASRLRFKAEPRATGSLCRPRASAPPCVVRSRRAAPAFGSCLACFGVVRVLCRSALVGRFMRLEASCLAQVWRGKLALMVRQQSVLHQPPNPSIERTANGGSRLCAPSTSVAPSAAAHVQR